MNPTPVQEGIGLLALARKSLRASANFGRMIREQSWLKLAVISAVGLLLVGGLGRLFFAGFVFIGSLGGAGMMIVQNLFAFFFLGLGAMLVFSNAVTAYSAIFRSEEMGFLLVRPIAIGQVLIHKFWEVALLSSWAFFFMVIPFVGAYALHEKLSPFFALWTLLCAVPFVLICAAIGTMVALIVVRWVPRGKWLWITLAAVAAALGLRFVLSVAHDARTTEDTQLVLSRLIPGMKLSSHPLWPSWWMAESILSLSRDNMGRGVFLWCLLAATALLGALCVEGVGRLTFYASWHRLLPVGEGRRRVTSIRGLERWMVFLQADTRAVLIKDIRVFLRDPMQWSQALVFFGLLAIYFFNLRNMKYHLAGELWRNVIAWLNVISISAIMCSLSARFVYPQMSMEGHSFWILGLSPMSMRRVLRAKFGLSFAALAVVGVLLAGISMTMLNVGTEVKLVSMVVAASVAAAVSALSTGLGSFFLDLRNRNPVAIISGFGGTLNLVIALAFIFAAVLPFGAVSHAHLNGRLAHDRYVFWLAVLSVYVIALTLVTVLVPLYLGRRSLSRREY